MLGETEKSSDVCRTAYTVLTKLSTNRILVESLWPWTNKRSRSRREDPNVNFAMYKINYFKYRKTMRLRVPVATVNAVRNPSRASREDMVDRSACIFRDRWSRLTNWPLATGHWPSALSRAARAIYFTKYLTFARHINTQRVHNETKPENSLA